MKRLFGMACGLICGAALLCQTVFAAESGVKIFQVTSDASDIYFYVNAMTDGESAKVLGVELHIDNTQKTESLTVADRLDITQSDIQTVADTGAPQSYMFLIDAYNSSEEYVNGFTSFIGSLMDGAPSGTTFSIVTIVADNKIELVQDFTSNQNSIKDALGELKIVNGGTSLYTGLMKAIELYNESGRSQGEIANIVVISDGIETAKSGSVEREDLEQAIEAFNKGRDPSAVFTIHTLQYKASPNAKSFEDFAEISHGTYYNMAEENVAQRLISYVSDSYVVKVSRAALISHGWRFPLVLEASMDVFTPNDEMRSNVFNFVVAAVDNTSPGGALQSGGTPIEAATDNAPDKAKSPVVPIAIGAAVVVIAAVLVLVLLKKRKSSGAKNPGGVYLKVETVSGGNAGTVREISLKGEILIGRDASRCKLVFQDSGVSSVNARIFLQDGMVYIEDLQSLNGTAINDMTIHTPNKLRSGDIITIGATSFAIKF